MSDDPFDTTGRREQYLEKPLPSSEESERVILGAILLDSELIHNVGAYLQPEMFYHPHYKRIFDAMLTLSRGNLSIKGIDPINIGELLKMEGSLDSIGGITAITNLTFGLPHFSNIDEYVQIVRGKAALRSRIRTCNAIITDLLAEDDTSDNLLQMTEHKFNEHIETAGHSIASRVSDMSESIGAFENKIAKWEAGKKTSIPSPYPLMNRLLNERGFSLGDQSIVAARPSDGKTTYGVQNALHCARHFHPALVISIEMSKEDIIQKILAGEARVPNYRINEDLYRSEYEKDREMVQRLNQAKENLKGIPLYIDDESQSLSSIMSTMMDYVIRKGVRFIFIDYAQIIVNDISGGKRDTTRDRELGMIADRLKQFAKKETRLKPKVHIQLAVQLKRLKAVPTLDDLRESGAFEQVADLVIAPFGEKPKEEVIIREMKLLCLKQRKGRMGWQLPINFHGDWQRFYDRQMEDDDRPALNASTNLWGSDKPEF